MTNNEVRPLALLRGTLETWHIGQGSFDSRFQHLFHLWPIKGLPALADLLETLFRDTGLDEGQPGAAVYRFQ